MSKILQAESTLTDRYQTTIPEAIREALHLEKRDKITYIIEENGRVFLSRASDEDPVLDEFLHFLANDIKKHPSRLKALNSTLLKRAESLVSDVDIDLDAPLSDKDE